MNQATDKKLILNTALAAMEVEDLLGISGGSVALVTDRVGLPDGMYKFDVTMAELDTVGKDDKPAIRLDINLGEAVELTDETQRAELADVQFPVEYSEGYVLKAKNGFGIRSFITFISGYLEASGQLEVPLTDILPKLAGLSGICRITAESRLRHGADDKPENRYIANRIKVNEVIWD